MERYEKLEKVGEGVQGTGQEDLSPVALKKTRLEMDEEGIPPSALREVSLLQMLSNSIYIVRLLDTTWFYKNGKPRLYLDTDLNKYIDTYCRGPNPRL